MFETVTMPLRIAQLWARMGGNGRICYRRLVEWMSPSSDDAIALLRASRPFLISSTGRTGTMWLANLLDKVERAYVVHEPVPEEWFYHAEAFSDPATVAPYLRDFRLGEMALRVRGRKPEVYGEVNGALRRHVAALCEFVPQFRIIHLVRDGRDVVTSVMNTMAYTPQDKIYGYVQPSAQTMDSARWQSMDRFARVCWMWAHENACLREHAHHQAKFEDITTCYDRFREQILDPLALNLDETVWGMHANQRENATRIKRHSGYEGWTDSQKDTFRRLCGKEMAAYGYLDEPRPNP